VRFSKKEGQEGPVAKREAERKKAKANLRDLGLGWALGVTQFLPLQHNLDDKKGIQENWEGGIGCVKEEEKRMGGRRRERESKATWFFRRKKKKRKKKKKKKKKKNK